MSGENDESAWERSLASNASDILNEPGDILRALRRATLDSKLVELEFAGRTRTFFSELAHGPHPDEEAALVQKERDRTATSLIDGILRRANEEDLPPEPEEPPPRLSYDYLEKKSHLFLTQMVPHIGNAMLPNSQMLLLRVFHGVKALEAPSVYMGTLQIGGETLVKVGFPMRIFVFAKRRHFRAQVAPYLQILVEVVPENKRVLPFTTKLMNISAGGLAFCNPLGMGTPAVEQRLALTIYLEDAPEIKVTGIVRNHAPNTPKEGCGKQQSRCGVQFEITSQEQSMHIEELVAMAQRQVISMVAESQPAVAKPPVKSEEKKPLRKEPSALERFFEVKKRKSGG